MNLILVVLYFMLSYFGIDIPKCSADSGDYVTVFDDGHQGAKTNVSIAQCNNLSGNWINRVSAIATHGLCARLFDRLNCTGNSIEVMPTSPAHHDLNSWNFSNKAVSVGPCRHECSTEITGNLPNASFQINIYNQANYQGLNRSIDVQGCVAVPFRFLKNTRSIHSYGNCVQLYSNPTCDPHLGRNVELRRGTPYHNDLAEWEMTQAKSVSHCAHKCTNDSRGGLKDRDVVLFDEHNLKGNYVKFYVREGNCLNFSADWEAKAMSVQVFNSTCVTLFDQRSCMGKFLRVNKSTWNLEDVQFQKQARSIKSCYSPMLVTPIRAITDSNSTIETNYNGSTIFTSTNMPTEITTIETSTNNRSTASKTMQVSSIEGGGMSPLLIFVIVLLVLITFLILGFKLWPSVRNNINRYYGSLRRRLLEEDGNEEYFTGVHWAPDNSKHEKEKSIERVVSSEITNC